MGGEEKRKPRRKENSCAPERMLRNMRPPGILRIVEWQFLIDDLGQPIGRIFKGQSVQKENPRRAQISFTPWWKPEVTQNIV